LPVRVNRAGDGLTTFQVRALSSGWLRIGHPLLRRRDVSGLLHTLLRSTYGVQEVRVAGLWASVQVVYDLRLIDADQLLRLLDDSWSFLLQGPPVSPPTKKLFIASALVALAFTGQFLRPALGSWATAAVALYSLPNAIRAVRDLRHGQIGVPAMASVSLGFLLWTGMPFASSVMATFAQLWPALANGLASRIEHRLFAEHHRRVAWARLASATDTEARVELADLRPGTTVWARKGDTIPVDGNVLEGLAAIDERILTGVRGAVDRTVGDKVFAGALVRDGAIAIRAERVGGATSAAAPSRAHCPTAQLPACPRAPTRSASRTGTPSPRWFWPDSSSSLRAHPDCRRSRSVRIMRARRVSARICLRCAPWWNPLRAERSYEVRLRSIDSSPLMSVLLMMGSILPGAGCKSKT
jgi:E1-E2 ATPase